MKKIASLFLILTLMFLSMTSLVSCGLVEDGAEISVYLSDEVYDFDPAAAYTDDNTQLLISLLFEPLFTLDEKGKVRNAAAKDYEIDRATGAMTITLRESYWSDGERVLAGDFVYAWRRVLDPEFASPAATLLLDVKNAAKVRSGAEGYTIWDVGINAINEKTIRIEFEAGKDEDHTAFLRNLCSTMLAPVRSSNVQQSADHWTKTAAELACNGPFHLKQLNWVYGYLTLERNSGYHRPSDSGRAADGYVTPSLVRTLWQTDTSISHDAYLKQMYEFFEQKVVFYIGAIAMGDRATTKGVKTEDRLSTYSYVFNTASSCTDLANPEIRAVLSSVIDREDVVNRYFVYGEAATGLLPPSVMNHNRTSSFRKKGGDLLSADAASLDSAQQKLAELGATFGAFSLTYNADHADEEALAHYVADRWEALGYTVNLRALGKLEVEAGDSTYSESGIQVAYETGDYDVIGIDFQMMSAGAFAPLAAFSSAYNGNTSGWVNATYDELIDRALAEQNAKKKAQILHEAEELLLREMPIMPIMFRQTYYVQNTGLLKKVSFGYNGFPVFTKAKLRHYDRYFFDLLEDTFFPESE